MLVQVRVYGLNKFKAVSSSLALLSIFCSCHLRVASAPMSILSSRLRYSSSFLIPRGPKSLSAVPPMTAARPFSSSANHRKRPNQPSTYTAGFVQERQGSLYQTRVYRYQKLAAMDRDIPDWLVCRGQHLLDERAPILWHRLVNTWQDPKDSLLLSVLWIQNGRGTRYALLACRILNMEYGEEMERRMDNRIGQFGITILA